MAEPWTIYGGIYYYTLFNKAIRKEDKDKVKCWSIIISPSVAVDQKRLIDDLTELEWAQVWPLADVMGLELAPEGHGIFDTPISITASEEAMKAFTEQLKIGGLIFSEIPAALYIKKITEKLEGELAWANSQRADAPFNSFPQLGYVPPDQLKKEEEEPEYRKLTEGELDQVGHQIIKYGTSTDKFIALRYVKMQKDKVEYAGQGLIWTKIPIIFDPFESRELAIETLSTYLKVPVDAED